MQWIQNFVLVVSLGIVLLGGVSMDIINDFKNDKYKDKYFLLTILSLITFKRVKKIEQKKKDLYNKLNRLD